eukprot:TRINITY_DN15545_c0_g1_i6.p1 TRINITY_DN15545_c0_g1~~TRINITY_DN15545_c0_g1_i6.p1  ORF type:complete len:174 (-),score=24.45 TRINITY_DN15545_c0_g1_i6:44-565(-)
MDRDAVVNRINWDSLWSMKAPPRVIAFGWSALLGGILTMDNLQRRRMVVVNACPMCLVDEESIDHLLLNCRVPQCPWKAILGWFHYCSPLPHSLTALFKSWRLGVGPKRGRIMWRLSFLAAIWTIWKERNARCFEGKSIDEPGLQEKVKLLVAHWVSPLPLFKVISVSSIVHN